MPLIIPPNSKVRDSQFLNADKWEEGFCIKDVLWILWKETFIDLQILKNSVLHIWRIYWMFWCRLERMNLNLKCPMGKSQDSFPWKEKDTENSKTNDQRAKEDYIWNFLSCRKTICDLLCCGFSWFDTLWRKIYILPPHIY